MLCNLHFMYSVIFYVNFCLMNFKRVGTFVFCFGFCTRIVAGIYSKCSINICGAIVE